MKVSSYGYHNHKGTATVFKAETEEEIKIIKELKELIEDNRGILSRKCFSFDDNGMMIEIDKR